MIPMENAIDQNLCDGQYENAVQLFLKLVDFTCYHFIADEHWCWFDDMYDPDYALDLCWSRIRDNLIEFPEALRIKLEKGEQPDYKDTNPFILSISLALMASATSMYGFIAA